MDDSVLALDLGNTSLKYGLFVGGACRETGRRPCGTSLQGLPAASVVAAVSVHPPELDRVRAAFPALRVVGEHIPVPLPVLYEPPGDLGLDRVMGVVGALSRAPEASGILLLDAGTCLTATVGLRDEGVLGGAILPGLALMSRALHEGTQVLPLVEPREPEAALGRSTRGAIQAGLWFGVAGAARELVRRIRSEVSTPLRVVATGTGAEALGAAVPEVEEVLSHATLWGVAASQRRSVGN